MKILVTGGCGFLGHNLFDRLRKDGDADLVCLDPYEAPFLKEDGITYVKGDLSDSEALAKTLDGVDVIIHMACTVIPKTSNEDPAFDVVSNVTSSIRLLDAAVKAKVKKFIFISSGGVVYGVPQTMPIMEVHPTNPICSYGITKLTIEKYLRLYNREYGLKTCSLRLANPYGPYQRPNAAQGAPAVFCAKALKGETIEIWGDGTVARDFFYVEDAVDAIIRAVECERAEGEINVGSGIATSLNMLVTAIRVVLGKEPHVNYLPGRSFDVPVNVLDITRAADVLGWKPRIGLIEGIAKTLNWQKEMAI